MTQEPSKALVSFRDRRDGLVKQLHKMHPHILSLLPDPSDAEVRRMISIVSGAVTRNPRLLQCHLPTVIQAVLQGAECGLEIGGVRGEAYLVPFWNTKQRREDCQFIAGYKGLAKLMLQTPRHRNLEARLVYEGDSFSRTYGSAPLLIHRPSEDPQRTNGKVLAAYTVLHFADGLQPQFVDMDISELEAIRSKVKARNRGKESGPWATDTHAMYKKCPIRQLANVVELSPRARKAIEFEQAHELPAAYTRSDDEPGRADALKAKLGGAPPEAPPDPMDELTAEEIEGELVEVPTDVDK